MIKRITKRILERKYRKLFEKHGILMGKDAEECDRIWNKYKLLMGIE